MKRAMTKVVLVLLCSVVLGGQLAYAQTTSDPATIAALQKQIELLLAEVQSLKSQVTTLRSEFSAPTSTSTPTVPILTQPTPSASPDENNLAPGTSPAFTVPTITHTLTRGTRSDEVHALQEFLAQDPSIYPEGLVTSYFGPSTQNAVIRWQKKYGVEATGLVGPRTIAKFRELRQAQSTSGAPLDQFINQLAPVESSAVTSTTPVSDHTLLGRNLCPAMPTVTSCPAGQEKAVAYQSLACGTYYTCVPVGASTTSISTIFNTTTTNSTLITPPAGQREQIWNSLGMKSWVRTDADPNRIEGLKQACQNTPASANIWMVSAGNPMSVDFGMPSPERCRLAAVCSASQYFNGASCSTFSSTSTFPGNATTTSGGYTGDANSCPGFSYSRWDSSGHRYCQLNSERRCDYTYPSYLTNGVNYRLESCPASDGTTYPGYATSTASSSLNWVSHIWNFRSGGSQQSYILKRTDREYLDFIVSLDTQCRTIDQNRFAWRPGAGNDAASNWQNFGIPDCSGSAVTNSTSSVPVPPSGQKEQAWNNQGLRSWIRSDADPARIEQLKQACAATPFSSNIWTSQAGTYSSSDFGMPDPDKCRRATTCSSNQYFDGVTCSSGNPYGSSSTYSYAGDANSCPGFSYSRWDSSGHRYCQLNSERRCDYTYPSYLTNGVNYSVDKCPAGDYPANGSTCPSGQYWNGSACVTSGSSYASCDWSSQYLKMSTNTCQPRSNCTTPSNPEYNSSECQGVRNTSYTSGSGSGTTASCPSGQYWYTYPSGGGYCTSASGAQGAQTCPSGQVWSTPPSGGSGYCQSTSGSYSTSDAASGCTQAGGTWQGTYCQMPTATTCPSGQYWNGSYCMSSTTPPPPPPPPSSSQDPATMCAQYGGTWNGSTCQMPSSSPPPSPSASSNTALTALLANLSAVLLNLSQSFNR